TAIRIAVMLIVGWWVHKGNVSIGDYILFTSLAARANDPLRVFLGLQQQVMITRESLRRLGLLCGVHFGIERPLGGRSATMLMESGVTRAGRAAGVKPMSRGSAGAPNIPLSDRSVFRGFKPDTDGIRPTARFRPRPHARPRRPPRRHRRAFG